MKTLREIATIAELPESTLRLYRDEFEEFLPAHGEGRRRRYSEETAARIAKIAGWKKQGWTSAAVREELAKRHRPEVKARRRTNEQRLDDILTLLAAQAEELAALRLQVGELQRQLRAEATPNQRPRSFAEALQEKQG